MDITRGHTPETISSNLLNEAVVHIGKCTGMIEMLKRQPDFAITIEISGENIGLCNNEAVIKLLKSEIKECELCIDIKPNKFE